MPEIEISYSWFYCIRLFLQRFDSFWPHFQCMYQLPTTMIKPMSLSILEQNMKFVCVCMFISVNAKATEASIVKCDVRGMQCLFTFPETVGVVLTGL